MKKPILFVLYISIACSIGFIVGVNFGNFYGKNIVIETINEHDGFQKLMSWYQIVIFDKTVLDDLESIQKMDDVSSLIKKVKRNGTSHINMFREQAKVIKKGAPNKAPISMLEESLLEFENEFLEK